LAFLSGSLHSLRSFPSQNKLSQSQEQEQDDDDQQDDDDHRQNPVPPATSFERDNQAPGPVAVKSRSGVDFVEDLGSSHTVVDLG
jgi:hypothetical protein